MFLLYGGLKRVIFLRRFLFGLNLCFFQLLMYSTLSVNPLAFSASLSRGVATLKTSGLYEMSVRCLLMAAGLVLKVNDSITYQYTMACHLVFGRNIWYLPVAQQPVRAKFFWTYFGFSLWSKMFFCTTAHAQTYTSTNHALPVY